MKLVKNYGSGVLMSQSYHIKFTVIGSSKKRISKR